MEHLHDWLVILVKSLHIPFILGLVIRPKKEEGFDLSQTGFLGDNAPHVFMK